MLYDYEAEYNNAFKKNRLLVKQQIDKDALDKKINTFCNLHGFEKQFVIAEIKRSEVVQAFFAINPNKQNFYEKKAAKAIESIDGVTCFKNLPNNFLYLVNGGIMTKEEIKNTGISTQTKTIDFQWSYKNKTFYASHKYTKESGGAQHLQYKDLEGFISEANKSGQKNIFFIAVADGKFYQTTETSSETRLNKLKTEANNSKGVYACSINELKAVLNTIVPD